MVLYGSVSRAKWCRQDVERTEWGPNEEPQVAGPAPPAGPRSSAAGLWIHMKHLIRAVGADVIITEMCELSLYSPPVSAFSSAVHPDNRET